MTSSTDIHVLRETKLPGQMTARNVELIEDLFVLRQLYVQ